jgi:UDP-N-acetylmuramyl pentapeptide phosphotransferase/UDP-N-acetylglucosamine-1-phosphate transferase
MGDIYFDWRPWMLVGPAVVASTFALTVGLIVLLLPVLRRHALARPNARSSHTEPTPQGGGTAVVVATVFVVSAVAFAGPLPGRSALWPVLGFASLLALIGAIDDVRTIPVTPRLLLQALAIAAVIVTLPNDLRVFPQVPWALERVLLLIGGLWFVNLVNFMDGIDWMTVAEVVPVSAALVLLGLLGAMPRIGTLVALALFGAILGFAPFNRPVARLFLGDVGSLPIGLLLAWLFALLAGRGHLPAALLLPLYYLADATVTLLRRVANRQSLLEAHREHFYQRARAGGFSVHQIVGRVFAVNTCLALLAALTAIYDSRLVDVAALTIGATLVGALLFRFARGPA